MKTCERVQNDPDARIDCGFDRFFRLLMTFRMTMSEQLYKIFINSFRLFIEAYLLPPSLRDHILLDPDLLSKSVAGDKVFDYPMKRRAMSNIFLVDGVHLLFPLKGKALFASLIASIELQLKLGLCSVNDSIRRRRVMVSFTS